MPSIRRCVFGCVTNGITLHNFPNPTRFPEQFELWVKLVGEPVENLTPEEIYGKKKVCDLHFADDDRNRNNRLNAIATPVPFPYQKRPPINRRKQCTSTNSTVTQIDLYQDPDLDLHEECSAIFEEQAGEGIVPVAKPFSWQKQSEALPIETVPENITNTTDNVSMYCDFKKTSLHNDQYNGDKIHEGFHCDVCKNVIKGFRYTCVQCNDFDLCSACELNRAHPEHYVLRIPQPRPYAEIQLVLATIRRYLMQKLDPITELKRETMDHPEDNISIKSEVKSDSEDDDIYDQIMENTPVQDSSHSSQKSTLQNRKYYNNKHCNIGIKKEKHISEVKNNNSPVEERNIMTPVAGCLQRQTDVKPKPLLLNNVKKKILIKRKDIIKVLDGDTQAKKICIMPAINNKPIITQRVVTQQLNPANKLMLVKLPQAALLHDGRKVTVQMSQQNTGLS